MKRKAKKATATRKLSIRGTLHRYFEKKEGQSASGFLAEVKTLTDNEQLELAQDAARMMGFTKSQVAFSLK